MNKLALSLLLSTSSVYAIETDKAAHAGISFATNTVFYGLYSKVFKANKTHSIFLSAVSSSLVGLAKEALDKKADSSDVLANSVGIAGSSLVILTFDF